MLSGVPTLHELSHALRLTSGCCCNACIAVLNSVRFRRRPISHLLPLSICSGGKRIAQVGAQESGKKARQGRRTRQDSKPGQQGNR